MIQELANKVLEIALIIDEEAKRDEFDCVCIHKFGGIKAYFNRSMGTSYDVDIPIEFIFMDLRKLRKLT